MTIRDVTIIGSGPAGLTAAIYTARANLNPLVIEGEPSSTSDQPGGQLMLTTDVENYPGFPSGIMGPELMMGLREQATRFGAEIKTEKVTKVDLSKPPFGIWTGNNDDNNAGPTYQSKSVIVATGAKSLLLNLDREVELIGHGVSTCATCDGFFFRDANIAVIGGGDSAMEEALFLTRFAASVTIIHRRDELRASKIMAARAEASDKINFRFNTVVTEYLGDDALSGLRLQDTQTGEESILDVTGCFVAIGHSPNTALFEGQLPLKPNGYLITNPDSSTTEVPGVFACGDVQDDYYRQAVTAAGSGCMAAIDAERYLESL